MNRLVPIVNKYNFSFAPLENSHLMSQLPEGTLYFRATREYCDCRTALGSKCAPIDYPSEINYLRAIGWNQANINSFMESKTKFKTESQQENGEEINRWLGLVQDILEDHDVAYIGILKHQYRGALQTEQFTIKEAITYNIGNIDKEFLLHIENDILYQLTSWQV